MAELIDVIRSEPYTTMTAEEVVTALDTSIPQAKNPERYSWAGVDDALLSSGLFTTTQLDDIKQQITSVPGGTTLNAYLMAGTANFADDRVTSQLEQLLAAPDEVVPATFKAVIGVLHTIGNPVIKRWALENLESLPTVEEVTAAKNKLALLLSCEAVIKRANDRLAKRVINTANFQLENAIATDTLSELTPAAIAAAVDALLASSGDWNVVE